MSPLAAPEVTDKQSTQEFEQLFRKHSHLVYRTAYSVTGNAVDAEDVLQTVFLRLVGRQLPPNLRNHPEAYLYRAAVNVSLNVLRSQRRRLPAGDLETYENSVHSVRVGEAAEVRNRLMAALDTMAESDSAAVELLVLRYVHNYRDSEIAKMFGKSRSAIAVRLFRARKRLKELLRCAGERP